MFDMYERWFLYRFRFMQALKWHGLRRITSTLPSSLSLNMLTFISCLILFD